MSSCLDSIKTLQTGLEEVPNYLKFDGFSKCCNPPCIKYIWETCRDIRSWRHRVRLTGKFKTVVIKKLHTAVLKEAERCESENCWLLSDSWATRRTPRRPDFSSITLLLCEPNKCSPDRIKLPSVPCCPKMAAPVLYWAAAAGSNYWLGRGKWGQMQCIIREPVDSGSPSQWL